VPHLAPETLSHHNKPRFDTPGRVHHAFGFTSTWLAYHYWSLARKLYLEYLLTYHESERVQHKRQYKEIGSEHCILHWLLFRLHWFPAVVDDRDSASVYCWVDRIGSGLDSPHFAYGLLLVSWME
jgi:hypothetical protein